MVAAEPMANSSPEEDPAWPKETPEPFITNLTTFSRLRPMTIDFMVSAPLPVKVSEPLVISRLAGPLATALFTTTLKPSMRASFGATGRPSGFQFVAVVHRLLPEPLSKTTAPGGTVGPETAKVKPAMPAPVVAPMPVISRKVRVWPLASGRSGRARVPAAPDMLGKSLFVVPLETRRSPPAPST